MIQTYAKNDLKSVFLAASFTRFDSCSKKPCFILFISCSLRFYGEIQFQLSLMNLF